MSGPRCPGMDMKFWKPQDVFEVECPACGTGIEFWKDEPVRPCPECKAEVRNPRIDLGCAQWCEHAEECLGSVAAKAELLSVPGVRRRDSRSRARGRPVHAPMLHDRYAAAGRIADMRRT